MLSFLYFIQLGFFTALFGINGVMGLLSSCANPSQVLTPAQCYPMGRSGRAHRYGVCVRQERGGEPAEREPQGALPLSHTGVPGEHRGWRGLHPVLYQRYDGGGGRGCPIYVHSEATTARKRTDLGPTEARCAVSGYRWNEIRTC